MDPISAIVALLPAKYVVYTFAGMGVCALVTAVWPKPKGPPLLPIWTILNAFGANVWHAKNATR